jgi:hypothetical protein
MRVPTNAKTFSFAFFEGSILSVPVGILLSHILPFTPPEWTAPIYYSAFLLSALALPVWSLMSFRDLPVLATIGLISWVFVIGAGFLLPAL